MAETDLNTKLVKLLQRKSELEVRLGITKAVENSSTRKSDKKFSVNSARAVYARAKKSEKAMLRMVNQMIQRTRTQLSQQKKVKNNQT